MTWVAPRTWTTGDALNATNLNEISAALDAIANWTSYTPTLHRIDTGAAVASSSQTGWYKQYGDTVEAWGEGTFGASSAGGAGISLPVVPATRQRGIGICGLWNPAGGTPADQTGLAYMTADRTKLVITAYTAGFRDASSGDVIRFSVRYKVT